MGPPEAIFATIMGPPNRQSWDHLVATYGTTPEIREIAAFIGYRDTESIELEVEHGISGGTCGGSAGGYKALA